jgi:hypothetical protein
MTSSLPLTNDKQSRDVAYWARQTTTTLQALPSVPTGALNLNVEGRRVVSPLQGFGQMWQKTYQVRLEGATITPKEVIEVWKANFPQFWPAGNRFFGALTSIEPGEVALLNIKAAGMPLSTGVMVLYADDECFTFMTPQGHVFAGWITFSALEEDGCTVVRIQVLMRANDPAYEFGLRFMRGHAQENTFWQHTLKTLAAHFGVESPVETQTVCVDKKLQWSQFGNVWHNSTIRTMMYILSTPVRRLGKQSSR